MILGGVQVVQLYKVRVHKPSRRPGPLQLTTPRQFISPSGWLAGSQHGYYWFYFKPTGKRGYQIIVSCTSCIYLFEVTVDSCIPISLGSPFQLKIYNFHCQIVKFQHPCDTLSLFPFGCVAALVMGMT